MTTDSTNVDASTTDGAAGNQPAVSQGQGQSIAASSQELLEIKKLIELQGKELKGLQSRQDKGQNEVQRFMDEVKQQMAGGKSFEEAEKAVNENRKVQEKDELLFKIAKKLGLDESSPTQPAGNGTNATDAVNQVIQKAGLDANSAEVLELISKSGSNPVDFALGVGELKARMGTKPTPSPTAASVIVGSAAPTGSVDVNAKTARLAELQKQPTKNKAEIAKLSKELDEVNWGM